MNDFDQFERRLGAALRSDADESVGPFEARVDRPCRDRRHPRRAMRLPRASSRPAGRFGRGRGITLLAAAALLLVGGALAAGSGRPAAAVDRPAGACPIVRRGRHGIARCDVPQPERPRWTIGRSDPSAVTSPTGVWIATGSMATPRGGHTAVRLLDGRVLVAGGSTVRSTVTSAELYDPASGTWSATGNMVQPHAGFPATLLRDGKVLVGDVYDDGGG